MAGRKHNALYCLECSGNRSREASRRANPLKRPAREYPVGSPRAYFQMIDQWIRGTNNYDDCTFGNGVRE